MRNIRTFALTALALSCLVVTFGAQTASGNLDSLYRAHQWFELRTAVTDRSPALMRGAVATAFNDPADSGELRQEGDNLNKFRGRPDQVNGSIRRSVLRHDNDGYLALPVSINGKIDDFLVDTGAWQSAMTEAEAKKLGLIVREETAVLTDASGTRTAFRTLPSTGTACCSVRNSSEERF